ncbi:MAG: UbiX family flavin prenyltransferase [Candidatus Methanomethylophilaceae archaeon]|mgnify:CR=1 FL=1|jgi:4-hydroxy-3-polyprenylbenzoate decarboxylase
MRSVVAISGASGSIYGIRLLQELPGVKILVMSETAKAIVPEETGLSVEQVYAMADKVYEDTDLFASIASGSFEYDCMFVIPCSESSVAKYACGIADTLISRAVSVCIKEGRKLILVPRETPKSAIMLENELKLARLGVVMMDANPGFYPGPKTVDDMVNFIVGRCLDRAGVKNALYKKWE